MTIQELPRVCGNCKHWERSIHYLYWGECKINMPVLVRFKRVTSPELLPCDEIADNCDCYTPKEEK
jgi:hypothetical protein